MEIYDRSSTWTMTVLVEVAVQVAAVQVAAVGVVPAAPAAAAAARATMCSRWAIVQKMGRLIDLSLCLASGEEQAHTRG